MTQPAFARYRAFFVLLLVLLSTSAAQASIPNGMLSGKDASLHPMLEKVLPSVVNVVVTGKAQQRPNNPLFNDPFFRQFFNSPPGQQQQQQQQQQMQHPTAIGSGVIFNAKKGYIVTNNHVVENAQKIEVRLKNNEQYKAKVVGTDPSTDLAVIQIKAKDAELQQLQFADSTKLQVGDFVVAVGNPFGLRQTVTSGIVSALGRHIGSPRGERGSQYQNFIQTDASINPGNSGGALVNLKGQLVGINSEILSQSGGNIGIGFAIPANMVESVAHQLIKYGTVKRGKLGVYGQNLTSELAKALNVEADNGVVITQVMPDSPAAKAGIKQSDVITRVNGKEIDDFSDLQNAIGLRAPGDEVAITLLRNGNQKEVHATLAKASEMTGAGDSTTGGSLNKALAGAQFGPISDDNPLSGQVEGVQVNNLQRGSPAAEAGLRPGDVITSINQHPISSVSQLHKLAGPDTKQLLLHVRRGQGAMFLLVQ